MRNLITIITIITIMVLTFTSESQTYKSIGIYKVQQGDTLWSIAEKYTDNNQDIRHIVWQLGRKNGITDGNIRPGQQITIYQ